MHTIVGTPYYVAPEVLKGNYDFACDIWSMGVILYIMLCGYPPFEGDNNKEIFKRVLQQKLDFDPEDWDIISDEAKELISQMLQKEPSQRISAIDCLNHKWFQISHSDGKVLDKKIVMRIKEFRAPHRLQMEALTFLVNNLHSDIDYKSLIDAFRQLDKQNTGHLSLEEIKEAFKGSNIPNTEIEEAFKSLDLNHKGYINYSIFLAATVEKQKVLTMNNLWFAFHHFDVSNSGFITEEGLEEVFHREGKKISKEMIHEIFAQADPSKKGKISFDDFAKIMQQTISKNSM
mmetsp:Transcript_14429/g.14044  ORF Transcript_14429/g.14044 Transcript_14429/m.14044 type:complete len:289 (-) Transcript_14429:47-913(-)